MNGKERLKSLINSAMQIRGMKDLTHVTGHGRKIDMDLEYEDVKEPYLLIGATVIITVDQYNRMVNSFLQIFFLKEDDEADETEKLKKVATSIPIELIESEMEIFGKIYDELTA